PVGDAVPGERVYLVQPISTYRGVVPSGQAGRSVRRADGTEGTEAERSGCAVVVVSACFHFDGGDSPPAEGVQPAHRTRRRNDRLGSRFAVLVSGARTTGTSVQKSGQI